MGITFNGTSIGSVKYNGTTLTKVIYNGVVVYEAYSREPLCFTANTAGSTIAMSVTGTPTLNQNFSYSTDGSTWNTFTPGTTTVTLTNAGDSVYFKGNNPNGINESLSVYYRFVMTGSIAASEDIMSLIDDGDCNTTTIPNNFCFFRMFYACTSLTTPPELPAISLTLSCYRAMFLGCNKLTTAPTLPSDWVRENSYESMFMGCTSLRAAPELPARQLANSCYQDMFNSCALLEDAPQKLPAEELTEYCYYHMFQNCPSLFLPPKLPATYLNRYCYYGMFQGCTGLQLVPVLPATTWAENCYSYMFYGCTNLFISESAEEERSLFSWNLPSTGTVYELCPQYSVFTNCSGTRSSDSIAGEAGQSYAYYTANGPVSV